MRRTAEHPTAPQCHDAIVVVPGILGSELVDPDGGEVVWGLNPRALAQALITGRAFDRLCRERLQATQLLRFPGSFPSLARFEPYTKLVRRLRRTCTHPDALLAHPYDWRQPLGQTARELASAAAQHLDTWRRHPNGRGDARLVFVAHSMGGLVAWHATNLYLAPADVAVVIALGSPFGGSVKALRAIGSGDLLPRSWLAAKLRACARALPALHDLLPQHPCLTAPHGCVAPSTAQLISFGADPSLLAGTITSRTLLQDRVSDPSHKSPLLVPLAGTRQQTLQSLTSDLGALCFHEHLDGTDWGGDGTVYYGAAYPKGHSAPMSLPQQHGALATGNIAIGFIEDAIIGTVSGPPQGNGIGLAVPDAVVAGETFEARIAAPAFARITCTCEEPGIRSLPPIPLTQRTNDWSQPEQSGNVSINQPGLYTITAHGGGFAAIKNDVLVLPSN